MVVESVTENSRERNYLKLDHDIISEAMKIRFFPIVMDSAQGCRIKDIKGREYIDFNASWAVANTGYCHEKIIEAVSNQIGKASANSPISVPNIASIELGKKIIDLLPGDFEKKIWFGHSGSEAGDLIAKFVPRAKGKPKLISFKGSYHGQTLGAASMSGHSAQGQFANLDSVSLVDYPNPYRYEGNEEDCAKEHLERVEDLVNRSDDYAGIIAEPIQSDGGLIVPPIKFLKGLETLCREHDIYFIIDEVKTGYGRTGKMFGFENWNLIPDAIMLGKPMGSGVPLSAVVGRKEILDAVPTGHMVTTGGNPVSCAAGLATLDIMEEERLAENAEEIGEIIRSKLGEIADKYSQIGDVRGRGLMIGVELVDPDAMEPDPVITSKLCYRAKELGLILFYVGLDSNVIEITPPLNINREDVLQGLEIFEKALEDVLAGKVPDSAIKDYKGW